MRKFDFYEFTAVLIPGIVLLFGFTRMLPHAWGASYSPEASASELTLFILLSYAAGFIVQSFGNLLEPGFWWCFDYAGKFRWPWKPIQPELIPANRCESPINRFRTKPDTLLTTEQMIRFRKLFEPVLGFAWSEDFQKLGKHDWTAIHRQIHAVLKRTGRAERCDIFAANYAMARGLLAAFIALIVIYLGACIFADSVSFNGWILLFLLVVTDCAFMRMNRYGMYLARETYVQFLTIKASESQPIEAKPT